MIQIKQDEQAADDQDASQSTVIAAFCLRSKAADAASVIAASASYAAPTLRVEGRL